MLVLALLAGCTGTSVPEPICLEGSAFDGETPAFRDASGDWGLDALDLAGVRLSAVDFDGDGWPDLAVRQNDTRMWLLRNDAGRRFVDVTAESGILAGGQGEVRAGQSWVWADVDNDGDLDVYTTIPSSPDSADRSELVFNDGDGTFTVGPTPGPLRRAREVFGAVFTDVDRDGAIDLFLGMGNFNPQQDLLFVGDGAGGFTGRSPAWGLRTVDWTAVEPLNEARAHSNAWAVEACDLNDDGSPDLLASSYGRAPNHLWQNQGDRFSNRSVASGYAFDDRTDWTDNESARCWCRLRPTDAECDGVPEPRIPCQSQADVLRWNHSTDREPFRLGGNSGQTVCADFDGDGALDLLTSEIVHWDVGGSSDPSEILHNTGEPDIRFTRPGNAATGLTRPHPDETWDDGDITGEAFDFDNDGRVDAYIGSTDYPGTRGLLYRNETEGTGEGALAFASVPRRLGIDHTRSHGSVVADFDRDGDLDLVVGHSTARCADDCYEDPHPRLFENLAEDSNFVQLELVGGPGTNRAAVGARVEVRAGDRLQVQEVDGGGGQFGNQSDLVLHFGLGAACEAEATVRWPNATLDEQTLTLSSGFRYRLVEGAEEPEVVEVPEGG